ncbi:MAG: cytochrome c oxidase accessory protein CcoG [Alphaproteobacteria bacterium]
MAEIAHAAESGETTASARDDGVEQVDVRPVGARAHRSLYKAREKVYPQLAHGTFRRLKWVVLGLTLGLYYIGPWLRWDRGPGAPDQAILVDFPARRFYFFMIEIWPQEVYYITGLLILAALGLFLVTSIAGRVWCGYACPQTVWTDLFIAVERLVEGDRTARIRLDKQPWRLGKIARKVSKHAIWLAIAIATGGAWVFYFADAPTLAAGFLAGEAPTVAWLFVAVFSVTTYALGGIAREQVCTYMCPWPRIQAALQDEDTMIVSYDRRRGEPRGPLRKNVATGVRGDCIDCRQCVAVCPAGIDIRDGAQLECISCALCVDACNAVMDKVGFQRGLVRYATLADLTAEPATRRGRLRLLRPRTVVYAALIVVVAAIMLGALTTRSVVEANVLRDRNPLYVTLSDGSVRNAYTLKILNKRHVETEWRLTVSGLPGAWLDTVGGRPGADAVRLVVPADDVAEFRVLVTAPAEVARGESTDIAFHLSDGPVSVREATVFRAPAP